MGRRIYRLCLLAVVLIAIAGGIFYYLNYVQGKNEITEGTMVQDEHMDSFDVSKKILLGAECCGKPVPVEMAQTEERFHE